MFKRILYDLLRGIGKGIGIWCDLDLNVPGLPTTAHIG